MILCLNQRFWWIPIIHHKQSKCNLIATICFEIKNFNNMDLY